MITEVLTVEDSVKWKSVSFTKKKPLKNIGNKAHNPRARAGPDEADDMRVCYPMTPSISLKHGFKLFNKNKGEWDI